MTNTASAQWKTDVGPVCGQKPYLEGNLIDFLGSSQVNIEFQPNLIHLRQLQLLFPLSGIKKTNAEWCSNSIYTDGIVPRSWSRAAFQNTHTKTRNIYFFLIRIKMPPHMTGRFHFEMWSPLTRRTWVKMLCVWLRIHLPSASGATNNFKVPI